MGSQSCSRSKTRIWARGRGVSFGSRFPLLRREVSSSGARWDFVWDIEMLISTKLPCSFIDKSDEMEAITVALEIR